MTKLTIPDSALVNRIKKNMSPSLQKKASVIYILCIKRSPAPSMPRNCAASRPVLLIRYSKGRNKTKKTVRGEFVIIRSR